MAFISKNRFSFINVIYTIFISLVILFFMLTSLPSFVYAEDLFVTKTGSGESCWQNLPCDLQTAIGKAGDGDTIFVEGGETYYGIGNNVIEITNSIMLLGGWNGSPTGGIVRDPEANQTILDGEDARRVIRISGSGETPTIDGFTITNGNATGLITDCDYTPEGCGGGIFIYEADPIISNNVIKNNYAATTDTAGYISYGGGIYISWSSYAQIINNQFANNVASTFNDGEGGGLDIQYCGSEMQINNNQFFNNSATTHSSTGWGGGIAMHYYSGLLENNIFENNTASPTSAQGSGIFLWYGAPNIKSNIIIGNQNEHAVHLGYFDGTFQSNRIFNNSTQYAVYILGGGSLSATIVNNVIEGIDTYSLFLDADKNDPLTATVSHNTIVGKGATEGVYIMGYSTVTMTNNIVSNYTTGVTVSGATAYLTQNNTLFYGNTSNGELGTNSVIGDPVFRNISDSDYSIKGNSAAKDAGIDAGITTDIEGKERPKGTGYDIGAYEFYPAINSGFLLILLN